MTNNIATCPEIANQDDSKIELSSYNTTVGTSVVIGCKGFGRHVSNPTNVVCQDTGDWSESPNLKCKIGFDDKEKVILAAAIVSAVLVLIVVLCLCCYCCCCRRRRRRHYWHNRGWWGGRRGSWKDHWRDGSIGRGSRKAYDGKRNKGGFWSGWSSKREYSDYPGDNKDKKGGFWSGWSSRRDIADYPGDDKEKKGGFWSGWSSRREISDYPGDDKEKKGWSGWSSRREISDHPVDDKEKKGGFWSGWSSRRETPDYPGDDKENKGGVWSGWSSRREHSDQPGNENGTKGGWWSGWSGRRDFNDNRMDGKEKKGGWWSKWSNRLFGDSDEENSIQRHYRSNESNASREQPFREEFGHKGMRNSYSNGSANLRDSGKYFEDRKPQMDDREVVRSRRYSLDRDAPWIESRRVRRFSDPSFLPQRRRYEGQEVTFETKPKEVEYYRSRRYSDPMIRASAHQGQEVPYDMPVSYSQSYKPSYIVNGANEGDLIKTEPYKFEHDNRVVRYTSPEAVRYTGATHVLDPLYYTDPRYYRNRVRYVDPLYSGGHFDSSYNQGLVGHGNGYQRWHGNLRLPPLPVNEILRHVNHDLSHRNVLGVPGPSTIVELGDKERLGQSVLTTGEGMRSGAHYEVTSINPATSTLFGRQDFGSENRTELASKVGNYVLYQGNGKTKELTL